MNVLPAFGVCRIDDAYGSVHKMYDRAKVACAAVKGDYFVRIKSFEPRMLEALESEFLLLTDVQNAFRKREFTFVLQPKCSLESGKIVGAEALARWQNAQGVISPGAFIPFLEKSGLISELDTYIWEAVCRWMRSMLDRGNSVVPVSVNVSRMDICAIDVPAYLNRLVEKYKLNPKLIELEITESAYSEDVDALNRIVEELRKSGFRILMDDFGSAYSSLNILKDIAVDVIKMDMRFLQWNSSNVERGADILETVCNMARILGLGIIAEGVETEEQRNLLLNAGCACGQGYYFYRPLEIPDFEAVIGNAEMLERERADSKPAGLFHLKDLLNKNILSHNMLNNMLGAVAFYDVCGERISVMKYNEQYAALLGNRGHAAETELVFGEQLYEEESERVFRMFDVARHNRDAGSALDVRRRRPDGADMWLHLRVFFLYHRDEHSIFYSTVTDVTDAHRNDMMLRFLNNDIPGGYYRCKYGADGDFIHISQRFLDIVGYTREEIRALFDDKFLNMVHPEDRKSIRSGIAAMNEADGRRSQACRVRAKNGYISVIDRSSLIRFGSQEVFQDVILCERVQADEA